MELTSEAFEMTSRKKMSLFWYSELMMMSMRRFTSAWNSYVSSPSRFSRELPHRHEIVTVSYNGYPGVPKVRKRTRNPRRRLF